MTDYYSTPDGESEKESGESKAVRLVVSGLVQGVGFRWYVKRVADDYGVNGYVRNLDDGSVESVAEGDSSAVHGFLNEVKVGPSSAHITGVNIDWLEYEGKYKGFNIQL
jgi:acylphosphatase